MSGISLLITVVFLWLFTHEFEKKLEGHKTLSYPGQMPLLFARMQGLDKEGWERLSKADKYFIWKEILKKVEEVRQ